jgi:hypothetical protein
LNGEGFSTLIRQDGGAILSGKIDVEASDGSRAHLDVRDMAFLDDATGKGHKTFEEGGASVFLRLPEQFDGDGWARGNKGY